MKYWETQNGDEIAYKDLKDDHLLNIIKWVEKTAKERDGEIIIGGGFDAEDIWYVEGTEKDWLNQFDHKGLLKEAKSRNLLILTKQ